MRDYFLAFIPLFVAVDALGVLPLFISLTQGLIREQIKDVVRQSMITGLAVSIFFLFLGKVLLRVLGITLADFLIAGGLVLFVIAINDIVTTNKRRRVIDLQHLGIVPLGMPLIVGPAVLATILVLHSSYGVLPTIISLVINILLAGVVFRGSDMIIKVIGTSGSQGISKLASLILAAYAVMMIRKGIFMIIQDIFPLQ